MSDTFDSGSGGAPAADQGTPAQPTSPGTVPAGSSTPSGDFLEIKWNNRVERLPRDRAVEFAQKGYDYTQKMQELARQRQEFESTRQQYDRALGEVRGFLQDPGKVEQYLHALRQQTGQAIQAAQQPGATEDELITAREMQAQLQQALAQQGQYTQQQISAMRAQFEIDQLASRYTGELDSHIKGLTEQFAELKAIPRIQQILKEEVAEMGPRTIEEAKTFMIDVAKQHAGEVRNFIMAQRKQQATAGSPLSNGIEPPAGAAPMPPASGNFKSVNEPGFKDSVLNDFLRISERMGNRG